jgi:hypothetical protein
MSGQILSFTKSSHHRTQQLLPWFVTGTLDAEERAAVEQHLQGCPGCRSELDGVRIFQAAYVSREMPPDTERALARLRAQLASGATAPTVPRKRPAIRLSGLLGRAPTWMRWALAAQFGLIVALGWKVWSITRSPRPALRRAHGLAWSWFSIRPHRSARWRESCAVRAPAWSMDRPPPTAMCWQSPTAVFRTPCVACGPNLRSCWPSRLRCPQRRDQGLRGCAFPNPEPCGLPGGRP